LQASTLEQWRGISVYALPVLRDGCLGGVKSGKGLQCLVNPPAGMEVEDLEKAEKSKRIAVAGGGLAGMRSVNTLGKELEGSISVKIIDDVEKVGNSQSAVRDGYLTARII
jgi:hypothetical protein